MPERADSLPADTPGSVNGRRRDPFWDCDDVLEVGPKDREIIRELRWAHEQEARGAFVQYGGRYLGIVNRKVQSVGGDPAQVIDEASRAAGVPAGRVALFLVEVLD